MLRVELRRSLAQVGEALREPEAFALHWHRDGAPYRWWVFAALTLTSMAGTMVYGLVMGVLEGPGEMLLDGLRFTAAAAIATTLPLPALYILNSMTGSRLRASTTFLATLVTTSWAGLALLACCPIAWFFSVALPYPLLVLAIHMIALLVVGVAMADVYCRVMENLEPQRGRWPAWWLVLVTAISVELFHAFGLIQVPFVGNA